MATEFNFKRAWAELAGPYYENIISEEAKSLLKWIATEGKDLQQDRTTLDTPIPAELLPRFEALPPQELALAACTIYFWGHWGHTPRATVYYPKLEPRVIESDMFLASAVKDYIKLMNEYGPPEGEIRTVYHRCGPPDSWGGSTWKFSNMADQVLHRLLGLPARNRKGSDNGLTWAVHEGKLRRQYGSSSTWTWEEVCWAVPHLFERAKACPFAQSHRDFEALKLEMAKHQPYADWFVHDFMDHKEGTKWDLDELGKRYRKLVADEFIIHKVDNANYNPHPFVIGSQHFDNGTINVHKARCAFRGDGPGYNRFESCALPYDKHTFDVVMFLECKKTLTNKEAHAALLKLKTAFEADTVRIDGFAFVKSKDGFEIQKPEPKGDEECSASDTGKLSSSQA